MSHSLLSPRWLLSSLLLAFPIIPFDSYRIYAEAEVEAPALNPEPADPDGDSLPLRAAQKTHLDLGQSLPSFLNSERGFSRSLLASDNEVWKVWRFQDYVVFTAASITKQKDAGDQVRAIVALMIQQEDARKNGMLVIEKTQPQVKAAWLKTPEAVQMTDKYAQLISNATQL
ncbi:MAG: hypothetical protein O3B01_21080 [Planctomycetota bacterium]|nr:hypothetical protein [Planctomycetota bacterium]